MISGSRKRSMAPHPSSSCFVPSQDLDRHARRYAVHTCDVDEIFVQLGVCKHLLRRNVHFRQKSSRLANANLAQRHSPTSTRAPDSRCATEDLSWVSPCRLFQLARRLRAATLALIGQHGADQNHSAAHFDGVKDGAILSFTLVMALLVYAFFVSLVAAFVRASNIQFNHEGDLDDPGLAHYVSVNSRRATPFFERPA